MGLRDNFLKRRVTCDNFGEGVHGRPREILLNLSESRYIDSREFSLCWGTYRSVRIVGSDGASGTPYKGVIL